MLPLVATIVSVLSRLLRFGAPYYRSPRFAPRFWCFVGRKAEILMNSAMPSSCDEP